MRNDIITEYSAFIGYIFNENKYFTNIGYLFQILQGNGKMQKSPCWRIFRANISFIDKDITNVTLKIN